MSSHMASLVLPHLPQGAHTHRSPSIFTTDYGRHHDAPKLSWRAQGHQCLHLTSSAPTLRPCSVHCTNQWAHILHMDISVSHSPPAMCLRDTPLQFCVGLGFTLPGSHGKSVHSLLDQSHSVWCICPRCSSSSPWSTWQLPASRSAAGIGTPCTRAEMRPMSGGCPLRPIAHFQDPWPFNGIEPRESGVWGASSF